MSLALPTDPAVRELFDVETLLDLSALPTFRDALVGCRRAVLQEGVRAVHFIAMRADGQVWLVRVGKRGGWRRVWNFSQ